MPLGLEPLVGRQLARIQPIELQMGQATLRVIPFWRVHALGEKAGEPLHDMNT